MGRGVGWLRSWHRGARGDPAETPHARATCACRDERWLPRVPVCQLGTRGGRWPPARSTARARLAPLCRAGRKGPVARRIPKTQPGGGVNVPNRDSSGQTRALCTFIFYR